MATDSTWTDRFATLTAGGQTWRSTSAFDSIIAGEVYYRNDDTWYPVLWAVWNGNLFCARNRGNNVAMITPPTPAVAVSYPSRALDTNFIISTTQAAQVSYTVELISTASLLGLNTDSADVDLQIDGISIAFSRNALAATISLGTAFTHTHRKVLPGYVPAGSTVRLASSGTGTSTFISAQEILL